MLALLLLAQTFVPVMADASRVNLKQKQGNNLVKVGQLDTKSYPKLDNKTVLAIQKQARRNQKTKKRTRGVGLFAIDSPYLPGQNPTDAEKAVAYGNLVVDFKAVGLKENGTQKAFQWNEIFGTDSNGRPGTADIYFIQKDAKTRNQINKFKLTVNKAGEYSLNDIYNKPAKLPLYSSTLEPYSYEVELDTAVTEKITLLTVELSETGKSSSFTTDSDGNIVATIPLNLKIAQTASTKFVSEWHTGVAENDRPAVNGDFDTLDGQDLKYFPFPKNDTDVLKLRMESFNIEEDNYPGYDPQTPIHLMVVPKVSVEEDMLVDPATYTIDKNKNRITKGDKTYKYDFKYDVINGGKLTMTEILPVTFDANGGKFKNFTAPDTETKIEKEVDYEGTLKDMAEAPTKDRETFKGWSTTKDGKNPATDADFSNITKAKTFYAIWDNNEIQAGELTVHESFKDGDYVNDFIPKLAKLKEQVTIKGANGTPQALKADDEFAIVDGTKEYKADGDELKDYLYNKLKEKDNPNGEPTRVETVKAKITHANKTTQEVDIPIKVIKNIYQAKTLTERPYYVPGDYVKVTLDPTTKAKEPQKTYYYVNKDAKVVIPGTDPVGVKEAFTRWTTGTGAGLAEYKLKDRHQFTDATTITAQYETGKASVEYVDENGKKIADTYKKSGVEYPTEMSGKLGDDVAKPKDNTAPEFEGYVFSSVNVTTQGKYADPAAAKITYKYYKKITTEDKSQDTANYFKVVFDANGGKFGTADTKNVYVYYQASKPSIANVKFEDVKKEAGEPSKQNENFVEWQDKKTSGTKVADDKAIVYQANTTETFYAHYEKAGAKIVYVDLKGNPIADKYKVGTDYPSEKFDELNKSIPDDVFTDTTAPKFIGYKFQRFELNPKKSKYTLDKSATIKIFYEKLNDVIPEKDKKGNPITKPEGYVTVEFVADDAQHTDDNARGKLTGTTKFYVNPKADKKNSDLEQPTVEPKTGFKVKDQIWTPVFDTNTAITADATYTAQYEQSSDIISKTNPDGSENEKPKGYVTVTFDKGKHGTKIEGETVYYVNPKANKKLQDITPKPTVTAKTGYKQKTGTEAWDTEDGFVIQYDRKVTAQYDPIDDVVPKKKPGGSENTQPDGYKTVTFKADNSGNGTVTETVYFVNPNKYVSLTPPTDAKGKTGYVFGAWSENVSNYRIYKSDTTITASFNAESDVVPKISPSGTTNQQPAGYKTVTFELEKLDGKDGGTIKSGQTVYYVNPAKNVTLQPPTVDVNTGYLFKEWSQNTATPTMYTDDTTVKGSFTKIDDIVDGSKPKPVGYVKVTFEKGEHGKEITGQTVYYVNPKANPVVKLGDTKIKKPSVTPETGYKLEVTGPNNTPSWDTPDDKEIKKDITVKAQFANEQDVIPKDNPNGGENPKPEGYISVTFSTEANGKIKDTTDTKTKVLYVNPNVAVKLDSYAPKVEANKGYKFARWDISIDQEIKYKDGTTIKALYNDPENISTTEVAGYVKVEFKQGDHGTLQGDVNLWVKPEVEVNLPAPTVKPGVGYKFKNWDKDLKVELAKNSQTHTITAQYEALENIIPGEKTKPEGYKEVKFKVVNGTVTGTTTFYVNPNVEVDLTSTANSINKKANVGYTADGVNWTPAITSKKYDADAEYTFTFKKLDDVIESKTGVTKPDGYVEVKVVPTDMATDKTEKTYFVNPNKEVTIPFAKPTGKDVAVDANNPKAYKWVFKKWTSSESPFRTWETGVDNGIKAQFTANTTITANYDKSITEQGTVVADEITVHESFKNGTDWVNNFISEASEANLKAAVKVNGTGGTKVKLPEGAKVELVDDSGQAYTQEALNTALYDKLQEKKDTEVSRTEKIKAKVTFKNGEVQDVEIPIKVIKNIYEAKTNEGKPNYVPSDYVKVTLDPTTKAEKPQKYFYYVNPKAQVVIPGTDPTGTGDNKFVKWTMKADDATGEGTEYKLADKPRTQFKKASTITAQYVSDVIPQEGEDKPDTVPANFVKVTFVPTDNGTMEGAKIFWVNPEKDVTIPVKDPVGKQYFTFKEWKIGDVKTGETYKVGNPKKFTDANGTTITATYEEAKNIIPFDPANTDDPNIARPKGYIKVSFVAENGLKFKQSKAYYVRANAKDDQGQPITLGNTGLAKPTYDVTTGYKFENWDKPDTVEIADQDIVVTAKAKKLETVIPEKTGETSNEKPNGYKEVTFVVKDDDKTKGSITGVAKFYVNPTEYVKITPPTTKANTGFEFGGWDKDAKIPTVYKDDAKITASFNGLNDVIPKTKPDGTENKKPEGYNTVTFVIDPATGGKIADKEVTVYYVNPAKDVTVPQPNKVSDTGYVFEKWNQDTTKAKKYAEDTTVKGNFKKLEDIIPSTDNTGNPNAKPEGYVTVTFKAVNGTLAGTTVYYVNPKVQVSLADTARAIKKTPNVGYKIESEKWSNNDSKALVGTFIKDTEFVFEFAQLDDVIPSKKDDGSDKPEGYFTVTFSTETNGKIKDTTDTKTKVLYVNPNVAVKLDSYAPKVEANKGYKFARWDISIDQEIKYKDGTTIKALYNDPENISTTEVAGYVKVEFKQGDHGTLQGDVNLWVKPEVEVNLPAPTVKPGVGYKFKNWDKDLKVELAKNSQTHTITAQYEALENIIPGEKTKPEGYKEVKFKVVNGTVTGTTTFYVNPNVEVDLTSTANSINKKANVGYTAEGVKWDPAITSKKYNADAEYTFTFKKLDDVIESKTGVTKPDGYVKVTLIPTDKATDETKEDKVFFVNPNKEVTITSKPTGKTEKINNFDYVYTFKGWKTTMGTIASWTNEQIKGTFIQETKITAQYSTSLKQVDLVPAPTPKKDAVTPKGDKPEAKDLIKNIPGSSTNPLPDRTKITYEEEPKVDKAGDITAKVKIEYPNGKTVVVEVPVKVVDNVVPQTGKDKPLVPESYVKVIVDTTDKAEENTRFEKTFWVKPNVEVTIPGILAPTGKTEVIDGVTKTNKFVKWKLEGSNPEKFYETEIKDTFTDKAKIVATYEQDKNVEPKINEGQWIPQGSSPNAKDFIANPYNDDDPNNKDNLPPGTKIEFVPGKEPNTTESGKDKETTIKITYPNGETKVIPVKYNVTGDVVEQEKGKEKPAVPDDYVKVVVKTTDMATDETKFERTFWVTPNKEVTITVNKPTGKSDADKKYVFDSWKWNNNSEVVIKDTFTAQETVIVANYKTTTEPKEIEQIPEVVSDVPIVSLNQSDIEKDWFNIRNKIATDSKIKTVVITEKPATDSLGMQYGKAKVTFENGTSRIITIKLKVVGDVIETIDEKRTKDVPKNYKLVILDTTSDAMEPTMRYFWINPDKDITLKAFKPQGKSGKVFDKWERTLSINWNKEGIKVEVLTIKAIYKDAPISGSTDVGVVEKHGNRYVERVAGLDRVHTAIYTSRRFFNKSKYVIIADSGNYPDALTATVLANVLNAPILLNNTKYLEGDVAKEITRLGATEVIIVGGHKSISENVKSQLAKYDQNKVQRIWGRDRYVTSSQLAYEIQRLTGKVNKAIIASGENFPDALATAPLGSKEIAPILLVTRNQMDLSVRNALRDLNIKKVYVAGGHNSVSSNLESQLPAVIRRFNGQDRYETAILVASYTYPESKEVFVASGEVFPDALVIGPVCARRKAPILLSKTTPVKATDDYIEKSKIEYLYIIGGVYTIHVDTAHKYAIED